MKQGLLIVDVQNYFINKNTQHIPQKITEWITANHPPVVVFSQFINSPDSQFVQQLNFMGCRRAPYSDIVDELQPWVKKNNVFTKDTYSIFSNPKFEQCLQKKNIKELIIMGLDTDFCVLADCFNAFDKGYKVMVIADCCASFTSGEEGHKRALKIIDKNLGQITK